MKTYKIPLVPGPVSVPRECREAYLVDYGSSDIEEEFYFLLEENQNRLKKILRTKGDVTIQPGEGMLVLWGALKSAVLPGDRVLALSNGLFGRGLGEMAAALGAEVEIMEAPAGAFVELGELQRRIELFRPALVTAVHCETPNGLLNPIADIAPIVRGCGALFLVDFVASAVGADVRVDDWGIDFGLLGSQKCLSLLPDLSILTVSERGWRAAERAGYAGYDAVLPWRYAVQNRALPCTHNWHANAALKISLDRIEQEGLENGFRRHAKVAEYCRKRAKTMGLSLYATDEALASPTVTAIWVPEEWTWKELDCALRKRGMAVGGNYGNLTGKVFRIGHMGTQADMELVNTGMDVLENILKSKHRR